MTVIRHKRGTGIPSSSDLKVGEIAIDTSTGTAYTKAGDGRIVPIGGNSSGGDGGGSGGGIEEAPVDNLIYGRQNEAWTEVVAGESLVHVDDDAPENPATGQLWFDTDNGTLNLFDGNDWINIGTGNKTVFTLPVSLRSGAVQLPVSEDADSLPVLLRSGEFATPLNQSGDILAVMTRAGELELPLAA